MSDKQYDKHLQGSAEERKLHGGGSIGCWILKTNLSLKMIHGPIESQQKTWHVFPETQ